MRCAEDAEPAEREGICLRREDVSSTKRSAVCACATESKWSSPLNASRSCKLAWATPLSKASWMSCSGSSPWLTTAHNSASPSACSERISPPYAAHLRSPRALCCVSFFQAARADSMRATNGLVGSPGGSRTPVTSPKCSQALHNRLKAAAAASSVRAPDADSASRTSRVAGSRCVSSPATLRSSTASRRVSVAPGC